MSDLFNDALGEFHAAEGVSTMPPAGAATIRAIVQRRRRVKVTTLSLLGALLIAVPVAAFAANPRGNNPPPVAQSSTPTAAPTPTPSQSQAPEARFTVAQLVAAAAEVPRGTGWVNCPIKVAAKPGSQREHAVFVEKVVHTNLDSDPALETAAWVWCYLYDDYISQVAAYDIDPDGRPQSLGAVVLPLEDHDITDLTQRPGGGVSIVVAWDTYSPEPGDPESQVREFAWDGTRFTQVAGPTAFPTMSTPAR